MQVTPKKGDITMVKNDMNKLIPNRTVTKWRMCVGYKRLSNATRKDHIPLSFMDQMLERLSDHTFYFFLDVYLGYN